MGAIGIIMFVLVVLPLTIMAIVLIKGKGAWMIAGYNTMSKAEKETYNEKALCRFVGWLLLGIVLCVLLTFAGSLLQIRWLSHAWIFAVFGSISAVIYLNTSKRFLKNPDAKTTAADTKKQAPLRLSKKTVILIAIVLIPLIPLGIMFYYGEREPRVNIHEGGIEISAIYGLHLDFAAISEISLVESGMHEIGVGQRTNGYSGFGDTLKGHFQSRHHGGVLLFVRADSAPTIHITRGGGPDVFISFRNEAATRALYAEMAGAFSAQ